MRTKEPRGEVEPATTKQQTTTTTTTTTIATTAYNIKSLPPKRNKRGGIGKFKKKISDHSLYACAAEVAYPSFSMEVPTP